MQTRADSDRSVGGVRAALIIGALGVVFGDIGTSPIYTVQTVFNPSDPHPVAATRDHVFGIVSLIFWSVTIIVTITYVLLVMRADNQGEGGIMALITLIRRKHAPGRPRTKLFLAGLGLFGAHATARFGYMDQPNVPVVLRQISTAPIECVIDADQASYFLSTIDLYRGDAPGLSNWRKTLFLATAQITADAADYFGLPHDRTVIMGSRIEV